MLYFSTYFFKLNNKIGRLLDGGRLLVLSPYHNFRFLQQIRQQKPKHQNLKTSNENTQLSAENSPRISSKLTSPLRNLVLQATACSMTEILMRKPSRGSRNAVTQLVPIVDQSRGTGDTWIPVISQWTDWFLKQRRSPGITKKAERNRGPWPARDLPQWKSRASLLLVIENDVSSTANDFAERTARFSLGGKSVIHWT